MTSSLKFKEQLEEIIKNKRFKEINFSNGYLISFTTSWENSCIILFRKNENKVIWHFYEGDKAYFGETMLSESIPEKLKSKLESLKEMI